MFFRKNNDKKEEASIGIIGSVDGPTSIFVAGKAGGEVRISQEKGKTRVTVGKGLFKKTLTLEGLPVNEESTGFIHEGSLGTITPYTRTGRCSDLDKLLSLGLDLDKGMGIMLCLNEELRGYEATPPNAVIFAQTGCDGQHFAFLPHDPKQSLDRAKVIAVDPMSGCGYGDAGMNFIDFLRLFATVGSVYFLFDLLYIQGDRERFDHVVSTHARAAGENEYARHAIDMIKSQFGIEPIEDLYDYFYHPKLHKNNGIV